MAASAARAVSEFDRDLVEGLVEDLHATPVFPVAGAAAPPPPTPSSRTTRVFHARISRAWFLGNAPEGGYAFCLVLAAAQRTAAPVHPDPVMANANYVGRAEEGPCTVEAAVLRRGGQYTVVHATLVQNNARCLSLTATFDDARKRQGPTRVTRPPPDVLPFEACEEMDEFRAREGYGLAFHQRIRVRRDPRDANSKQARLRGYIRLADGRWPDLLVAALLADSFRPPLVNYGSDVVGKAWFPTLDLSVQFRRPPALPSAGAAPVVTDACKQGWLVFSFETRSLMDGLHEVDSELWDQDGNLVALGR